MQQKMTEIVQIISASYNNFSEKTAEPLLKATNLSTPTNYVDLKYKQTCFWFTTFMTSV